MKTNFFNLKNTAAALVFSAISITAQAQTNIFPSSGNVGIGTTTPQTKLNLDLAGNATAGVYDGLRIHYNKAKSVVRGEIGFDGSPAGFSIHSYSGGSYATISFKTNNSTKMFITAAGNVGIGTTHPSSLLAVAGTITAQEIIVQDVGADYVFDEHYKLKSLEEVEKFVKANKHLPGIAPASSTEQGIKVGEFNEKLLEKIEELTLYMIELKKQNDLLSNEVELLKKK